MPPGAEADWQVREWVGKAGAGPGAAGGCGPASPPPPRDYLVPAAAMSPGRNVPPQIMLFISLGGSAARQHQAPGGRCARSPALPSSPCAAAAPGLGLAAVTARTQVSLGRAPRPKGFLCGCGCASMGCAPRAQRRRWAQGPRWGHSPRCRVWGCRGAREALAAAATNTPGRGNPRGLREALGKLGTCFGEADPGASRGDAGRAVKGVHVLVLGCLLQDPCLGAKGVLSLAYPTFPLPSLPPAAGLLSPGAAQILFWGTWLCAPRAAQRPGREDRTGQGSGGGRPPASGNDLEWRGADLGRRDRSAPSRTPRIPTLSRPKSSAPKSCYGPAYSYRLTSPSLSNNLALRNRKWEK